MSISRFLLVVLIALIAGCMTHPNPLPARVDADDSREKAKSEYREKVRAENSQWLRNHEVSGSHDGKWTSYEAMHAFFVERFIASEGFGLKRMSTPQDIARRCVLDIDGRMYSIGDVQLISLGDPTKAGAAGEPFAYFDYGGDDVIKSELKTIPNRKLSEFETEALAKLRGGERSVLGSNEGKRVLVGAVRANASCLKCHDVKEGALLGAFSYPLFVAREKKQL